LLYFTTFTSAWDTRVTLFAFGREVLMLWWECSVKEERLRRIGLLALVYASVRAPANWVHNFCESWR